MENSKFKKKIEQKIYNFSIVSLLVALFSFVIVFMAIIPSVFHCFLIFYAIFQILVIGIQQILSVLTLISNSKSVKKAYTHMKHILILHIVNILVGLGIIIYSVIFVLKGPCVNNPVCSLYLVEYIISLVFTMTIGFCSLYFIFAIALFGNNTKRRSNDNETSEESEDENNGE